VVYEDVKKRMYENGKVKITEKRKKYTQSMQI